MRLIPLVVAAALLSPETAVAQEWERFVSTDDGFSATFPGTPKVDAVTYDTEYRQRLPARVYRAQDSMGRYSTTVVDYRGLEKLHTETVAKCRAAKGANGLDGDACQNDFRVDVAGAMDHAAWNLMKRDGVRTTHYMWYFLELVAGRLLQLTNPDQSRTFAVIHQHDGRLYIHQATVPTRMPEPILFMQNLGFVNEKGLNIRYKTFYTEGYGAEWQFPIAIRPPHTLRDQTAPDYAP
jgi:hypothetical protein